MGVLGASEAGWAAGLALGAGAGGSGPHHGICSVEGRHESDRRRYRDCVAGRRPCRLFLPALAAVRTISRCCAACAHPSTAFLDRLPLLGEVLFAQSPLTYFAVAAVAVATWALKQTVPGLRIRAVGDEPEAAHLRGIDVVSVRIATLVVGGALAGFGGATITVGYLGSFTDDVTSGRGYVAIAVVIIGRWSPVGAMLGALLFALFDSLALLAQSRSAGLPVEFYSSLPYAMTLLALVLTARAGHAPRALGRGFDF